MELEYYQLLVYIPVDRWGSFGKLRGGELTEWSKVLDSKSSVPLRVPWVRIPRSPPSGAEN
jgi:hypothetical protein